ncbi:MAG: sigma-70 family RNA polymerase sigma factor [Elusimicrobia bacterium]|nr:sigma-70 family RNA polymerase sigma factor [Elusimicrobiota bacterium]
MAEGMGSAPGFEEFVRGYGERAFRFAYRLCGNVEDAKELVQEAFVRVLRGWRGVDPERAEQWYARVLRNLHADLCRRADRRKTLSLDAPPPGSEDPYAELLPHHEEALLDGLERRGRDEAVRGALAELSVEHRAVLLLCDVEGRSYADVSESLGVPLGTVRSRVSRARLALRRALCGRLEVNP